MRRSQLRRRHPRSRGQALVEFAVVIPVFLLVLSGMLDFGFMLYNRMTVINSAREGARAAVIVSDKTTIPVVAPQRVQSAAAGAGLTLNTSQVVVTCVAIANDSGPVYVRHDDQLQGGRRREGARHL